MSISTHTPTTENSARSLPELDEAGKSLLLWLYGRAREAEKFAGTKQTYGDKDPQGLEQNDWSGRLRSLIEMEYGQEAADEIFSRVAAEFLEDGSDEFDIEGMEAHEPEFQAMCLSLQKPGDERPNFATMLSLCRNSDPQKKAAGKYLKSNLHLVALPTREDVVEMIHSGDPKKHRIGSQLQRLGLVEEDRQDRAPTDAEKAASDELVKNIFKKGRF